jgi:uncharacterized delta-60 repeat protein
MAEKLSIWNSPTMRCVLVASTILVASDHAAGGDANLDPTFGTGGFVLTENFREAVADLAVLGDGRIVAAGAGDPRATVWRYTPDGAPDPTFGIGGQTDLPDMPSADGVVAATAMRGVAVTPDGKIVAVGQGHVLGLPLGDVDYVPVIFRLDPSGALDASFGSGGRVMVNRIPVRSGPQPKWETLWDVAVQPDGSIVAVGPFSDPVGVMVIRLLPDGALDPSFGVDGVLDTSVFNARDARAVHVLPDRRILVAGWGTLGGPGIGPFAGLLLRLLPDGSLDPSFGTGGVVASTATGRIPGFVAMARDGGGRLVVAGATGSDRGEIVVQRYQADGMLDASFGAGGTVQHFTASNVDSGTEAVTVMPGGEILVGGWTEFFGSEQLGTALLRLTSDGSPDTSFAPTGFARLELQGGYSQAGNVTALPDGRVLVAGQYSYIGYPIDHEGFVARLGGLCGNGMLDPGEECDDGNALGFDCCSTGCQLDPVGSACDLDGRQCTFDSCDGAGTCTAGGPAPACRAVTEPLSSQLKIRRRSDGDRLIWRWRHGEFTTIDDFGFPAEFTRFTMCFYAAGSDVGEVSLPVGAGWTGFPDELNPTQLRYRAQTGVTQVRLIEGGDGEADILIKGKGVGLGGLPALPLALPAAVRLLNDRGQCWGATYDSSQVNRDTTFSAKGD